MALSACQAGPWILWRALSPLVLVFVQVAQAQDAHPPPMTQAEHEQHVLALGLQGENAIQAQAAFGFYAAERAGADRAFRLGTNWSMAVEGTKYGVFDDPFTRLNGAYWKSLHWRWQDSIRDLDEQYFQQLRSIAPTITQSVDKLERARRRSWILSPRVFQQAPAGTTFDLIAAFRASEIDIEHNAPAQDILEQYEMEMDQLLQDWDRTRETWHTEFGKVSAALDAAFQAHDLAPPELDTYASMFAQRHQRHFALRELQIKTLDALCQAVPANDIREFRRTALKEFYPFVDGQDHPVTMIQAALRLSDLDEKQRAALNALREQFESECDAQRPQLNQLYRLTVTAESYREFYKQQWLDIAKQPGVQPKNQRRGQAEFDAAAAEWKTRVAVYEKQILDVLTPQQKERLR